MPLAVVQPFFVFLTLLPPQVPQGVSTNEPQLYLSKIQVGETATMTQSPASMSLCSLTLTIVSQREPLLNKLVYFLRSNPKGVSDKTCEQDIVAGELSKETLDNYGTLLSALYLPVFQEQGNWGKSDTEHTHQFLQVRIRLADFD